MQAYMTWAIWELSADQQMVGRLAMLHFDRMIPKHDMPFA